MSNTAVHLRSLQLQKKRKTCSNPDTHQKNETTCQIHLSRETILIRSYWALRCASHLYVQCLWTEQEATANCTGKNLQPCCRVAPQCGLPWSNFTFSHHPPKESLRPLAFHHWHWGRIWGDPASSLPPPSLTCSLYIPTSSLSFFLN